MFTIELAGHCLLIKNRYQYIEELCRDYMTDTASGTLISVTEEEIASESRGEDGWTLPYLESLAIYRKICDFLLDDDIILFHCSALCVGGKAYLFTAPSGTGKSTHTRLWREQFGDEVTMINDDKPLLSFTAGQEPVTVYGTPYGGKDNIQTNMSAPVAGIVILHQAGENTIRRMSAQEAFPMLLNQTYRRNDAESMRKTMELVWRLSAIPVWSMGCTISHEAAVLARDALTGGMEWEKR